MTFESDMEKEDLPYDSEEKLHEAQIPLALNAVSEFENAKADTSQQTTTTNSLLKNT